MKTLHLIGGAETEVLTPEVAGGKAANLSRMAAMGLTVPPAFVLPTSLCAAVNAGDTEARHAMDAALMKGMAFLEERTGRRFADRRRPLLVSVRSGAARSMPGMLETVLNVGCTLEATFGLIRQTGNPRFAWDCRRRFVQGYAETVLGLDPRRFDVALEALIAAEGVASDRDLDGEALERFARHCTQMVTQGGFAVPEEPIAQLKAAARTVFASWESDKARTYRRLQHLEFLNGTAVTVQAMVYGNASRTSGAGVAFSRDPSSGEPTAVVDLLFEAQGEDVVSGRRTPETGAGLARRLPAVSTQLLDSLTLLERAFRDVQDVEFTIEQGRLFLLQTRAAKRTPRAALRIAVAQVREGLITPADALERLADLDPAQMAATRIATDQPPLATGVAAAPGVACGRIAFDSAQATRMAAQGEPVILVRPDTSTADVAGFAAATGIVTAVGGRTAHAALVARQLGRPCVVGCTALIADPDRATAMLAGQILNAGDWLTVDGNNGGLYAGRLEIVTERPEDDLAVWAGWRAEAGAQAHSAAG